MQCQPPGSNHRLRGSCGIELLRVPGAGVCGVLVTCTFSTVTGASFCDCSPAHSAHIDKPTAVEPPTPT